MGHNHGHAQHHHHPSALHDYAIRDPQFARALTEDSDSLIPRFAQSTDNYGQGSNTGSSSGGSGSSDNYGAGSGSGSSDNYGSGSGSSSGGSSPGDCPKGNTDPNCPHGPSSNVVAITVGVIVPLSVIVLGLLIVWRIKKKKDRQEALLDKHGSLDFGLGEAAQNMKKGKKGKKGAQPDKYDMQAEKQFRIDKGLSLDIGSFGSPYVLPPEMTDSRPSFSSLTRSTNDQEDPYRAIGTSRDSPTASRPPSRKDSASVWTQSSDKTARSANANLLANAQRSPASRPHDIATGETPLLRSTSPQITSPLSPMQPLPSQSVTRKPVGQAELAELPADGDQATSGMQDNGFDFNLPPNNDRALPTFSITQDSDVIDGPAPPLDQIVPPKRSSMRQPSPDPLSHNSAPDFDEDYVPYADVLGIAQKESYDTPGDYDHGLGVQGVDTGSNRLSASIRPLPPDDDFFENPEDRANRIRSFYREYFDEKHGTVQNPYDTTDYYEDYNQEYLDGATVWDQASGQFVVSGGDRPYGQNVTRRAMTPPPRAPPRFRNGSAGGQRMYGSGQHGPGGRPRGYSSASAAAHRGRKPAKPLPPPKALNNLPTPHLLRDDSAIFHAADFAPPTTYKDRVAGRSESPMMDKRPYSPSVRAFTPLASSFDDLRVMPSPHSLRKSGTFTGLDFAPPPRIHADGASDAGSIRSGRSTTSARQVQNIRAGAYRVSRLPGEMVGTRNDFAASLKPQWDQRGPTPGL